MSCTCPGFEWSVQKCNGWGKPLLQTQKFSISWTDRNFKFPNTRRPKKEHSKQKNIILGQAWGSSRSLLQLCLELCLQRNPDFAKIWVMQRATFDWGGPQNETKPGWFQAFLIFIPIWGRFPVWLIFSRGLKPPTRRYLESFSRPWFWGKL